MNLSKGMGNESMQVQIKLPISPINPIKEVLKNSLELGKMNFSEEIFINISRLLAFKTWN